MLTESYLTKRREEIAREEVVSHYFQQRIMKTLVSLICLATCLTGALRYVMYVIE